MNRLGEGNATFDIDVNSNSGNPTNLGVNQENGMVVRRNKSTCGVRKQGGYGWQGSKCLVTLIQLYRCCSRQQSLGPKVQDPQV